MIPHDAVSLLNRLQTTAHIISHLSKRVEVIYFLICLFSSQKTHFLQELRCSVLRVEQWKDSSKEVSEVVNAYYVTPNYLMIHHLYIDAVNCLYIVHPYIFRML